MKKKRKGAHRKVNMKMEAEKRPFSRGMLLGGGTGRQLILFYYVIKRKKWRFVLKDQAKGVFSMCYELIHRGTNIF